MNANDHLNYLEGMGKFTGGWAESANRRIDIVDWYIAELMRFAGHKDSRAAQFSIGAADEFQARLDLVRDRMSAQEVS